MTTEAARDALVARICDALYQRTGAADPAVRHEAEVAVHSFLVTLDNGAELADTHLLDVYYDGASLEGGLHEYMYFADEPPGPPLELRPPDDPPAPATALAAREAFLDDLAEGIARYVEHGPPELAEAVAREVTATLHDCLLVLDGATDLADRFRYEVVEIDEEGQPLGSLGGGLAPAFLERVATLRGGR